MYKMMCLFMGCLFLSCCGQKGATRKNDVSVESAVSLGEGASAAPSFDADSAYTYVAQQVAFGPRVPNTEAHKACAAYLISELERYGAEMYIQETVLTAYNGDRLQAKNIIGIFNPEIKKRLLLFAHWDSRPYSDRDPDEANYYLPIDGADDGASGVGVLLEVARQISQKAPDVGIDMIFFDAEDYGIPEFIRDFSLDTYCLGSQFWAKNPHIPGYKADFGILLDMVGHRDATFYKEGYSMTYAAPFVERIWNIARNLGYGKYFMPSKGSSITDDHQYVITGRNIPCVNIIHTKHDTPHGFGIHWHTQNDTMENIDKKTLKAVGQTVLAVIYNQ